MVKLAGSALCRNEKAGNGPIRGTPRVRAPATSPPVSSFKGLQGRKGATSRKDIGRQCSTGAAPNAMVDSFVVEVDT